MLPLLLLTSVHGCSPRESSTPEGFMVACDSGSGCDSGLQCVDNPHQTKTSGEAMYCSAACSTAADCPEGTSSCMDGNIAACVDGFCDYSPFCM